MANFSAHSNSPFDKAKYNVHLDFTERAMIVHALSAVFYVWIRAELKLSLR